MNAKDWIGAKWWKFDFHTHTPASKDYGGKGPEQAQLKKITPKEWLINFMKAGIDCVAITDHNSGEWIDLVKNAKEELKQENHSEYKEIYIFPGVELSAGAIHILGIFDLEKKTSDIQQLLGAVRYKGTVGDSDQVTEESIEKVIKIIYEFGGIAIPAHADDPDKSLLRKVSGTELKQILDLENLYALEVVNLQNIKDSNSPNYVGNKLSNVSKKFSYVIGSDSHHPSGSGNQRYPGKNFTWVKMGNPSLDGLKLALLDSGFSDDENSSIKRCDSFSSDPNAHSSNYIQSISIDKTKYIGRVNTVEFKLNPWMNTIIGGRGTGKSSFIEFTRIAMRRRDEIEKLSDSIRKELEKYNTIPRDRTENGLLLNNSRFVVIYKKDNTQYKLIWDSGTEGNAIESFNGTEWIKEEGNIKDRFPISIYSQKQIYSFAEKPKHLLDMITEQKEIGYKEWLQKKEELENRFYSLKNKQRELKLTIEKESAWRGELSDVSKKILILEEKGYKDVLSGYQKKQKQAGYLETWENSISETPERLNQVIEDLNLLDESSEWFEDTDSVDQEMLQIIKTTNSEIDKIKSTIQEQVNKLQDLIQKWSQDKLQSKWKIDLESSSKKYKDILTELSSNSINATEEFGQLFQIKQDLESKIQKIDSTKKEFDRMSQEIESILNELLEHRKLLSKKRQDFLDKIHQTNSTVKMEILPFGNKQDVGKELREILNIDSGFENIIGDSENDEGFIFQLYGNEDFTSKEKLQEIKSSIKGILDGRKIEASGKVKNFEERVKKLSLSNFDRLDLYFPEDSLKIEYKTKNSFQPISQGSPGQKTAALLSFILSYGNDPLILDQPEDDLDNRLIYELIVTQLRKTKFNRQIIVVTHNANIVVNGDSELVYCLESKGGQTNIDKSGCLQDKMIREEICSILEGGKDAFQLRYKRIEPYA